MRLDGAKVAKVLHDDVRMQERLTTLPNSGINVQLIDGTALTLGSDADLVVDELVFDPKTLRGKSVLKLGTGTFYYVSGKLNREDIVIQTATTTIGIRGTQLLINVADNGATSVGVVSGAALVTSKLTGKSVFADVGESGSVRGDGAVQRGRLADVKTSDIVILNAATKGIKGAMKKAQKQSKKANSPKDKAQANKDLAQLKRNENQLNKALKRAERVANTTAKRLKTGTKNTGKKNKSATQHRIVKASYSPSDNKKLTKRSWRATLGKTRKAATESLRKRAAKTSAKGTARITAKGAAKKVAKGIAKTAAKGVAKTAAKDVAKAAAKDVAKTAAKDVAKAAAKAAAKDVAKAAAKDVAKAAAKDVAKAAAKDVAKAAAKDVAKAAAKDATKTAAKKSIKSGIGRKV